MKYFLALCLCLFSFFSFCQVKHPRNVRQPRSVHQKAAATAYVVSGFKYNYTPVSLEHLGEVEYYIVVESYQFLDTTKLRVVAKDDFKLTHSFVLNDSSRYYNVRISFVDEFTRKVRYSVVFSDADAKEMTILDDMVSGRYMLLANCFSYDCAMLETLDEDYRHGLIGYRLLTQKGDDKMDNYRMTNFGKMVVQTIYDYVLNQDDHAADSIVVEFCGPENFRSRFATPTKRMCYALSDPIFSELKQVLGPNLRQRVE